ncbi:phosphoenolpyruvate--protein phosphotransferase [Rhodococcus sp. NPDC058521]|uniref:phosphoenolpyruvate--protein phosphotransferase n=1 Tax=Rhodococcus sp. NPDC058521 TaxID=3346536 RepID=UPI003659D238
MTRVVAVDGTPAVPGVAYAPAIWASPRPEVDGRGPRIAETERDAEKSRFREAAAVVAARLKERGAVAGGVAAEVLSANAALAEDRGWLGAVDKLIGAGAPAIEAAVGATEQFTTLFTQMGGLMAERVTDLRDVRDRVVAEFAGLSEPGVPAPSHPSVLCAEDLAPADTAGLDPTRIVGIVTVLGGPTSHTAIIARQLGIPCVVAARDLDQVRSDQLVLLDGAAGTLVVDPDPDEARSAVQAATDEAARVAAWAGPGRTSDGAPISVLANVQDGAGARAAAETAAEGIGLFRTELCFLDRDTEPTVEEQAEIYGEVLEAFARHKVVIRTLDAGSDKPLRFVDHRSEANPALGVRGIRIAAQEPGILERQLDAIALAADRTGNRPSVMAPMVATVAEAASFADLVRARDLVPGAMIEVPAAALHADRLLRHVDFLSIGTNDLTQYTMAVDRMSSELAALTDPWQPAVLTLVATAADAGERSSKPVGVCGEAAADPLLACVLAGMGVTSLSCAAAAVSRVGAKLSATTKAACERAAEAALSADGPDGARSAALEALSGT